MKKIFIVMTFYLSACIMELPTTPELNIDLQDIENITTELKDSTKLKMNGIYEVIQGSEIFGKTVVARWIKNRWCIHSNHDAVFSANAGGSDGNKIILSGYVRTVRSGSGSQINLSILPSDGSNELLSDSIPSKIILRGQTSDGKSIILQHFRALNSSMRPFHILAHRGGGRNAERLGYSENSIEMITYSQTMGATAIEIDVKRTRDGELIVFHDDTFSPRTVKGLYLLGNVEDYDLNQIRTFGQLINGETIPTLSEALRAVIDRTELSLVWLDLKDASNVDETIRIQKEAIDYAAVNGRNDIQILLGIPNEDILNAYRSSSLKNTTPILIELDVETVLSSLNPTCQVWGPRWTDGISSGDIARVHNAGKKVIVWTLDVRDYIEDFLVNSEVDGAVTNYPSLVAGMYYSK